jgi:hypothetical protein
MPFLGPKHCFSFEEMLLKSDHFFGAAPHPNETQGGCQKGDVALLFGGFEGGDIRPHRHTNAEKPFTLSQCIEKMQLFEISFDEKNKQCKIVIFRKI